MRPTSVSTAFGKATPTGSSSPPTWSGRPRSGPAIRLSDPAWGLWPRAFQLGALALVLVVALIGWTGSRILWRRAARRGDRAPRDGPWTPAVHGLLDHIAARIPYIPKVLGFDERDREVLTYLPGRVVDN